ncbi:MAG: HEPN domain-containing protein [Bacteroidales bacterium]|nr:HEPN domain-containing protein [Bacteroidales bacterium]
MKKITLEWLNSAKDDLLIITKIIDDVSLTHQVAFHAQQALEKSIKSVIEEFEIDLIKTHSLETLFGKIQGFINIPIEIEIIKKLDQLYIDARYPGDIGLLPDGKPSIYDAVEFQQAAENTYISILNMLKNE